MPRRSKALTTRASSRLWLFTICVSWLGGAHSEDLNKSVLRVVATRDAGQAAISTGFLFRVDARVGVLTALHSVVGARQIKIKNESCEFQAQLSKVDIAHDLAFLSGVINCVDTTPLASASWQRDGVNKVIGYPQGIMTQKSEPLAAREIPIESLAGDIPGSLLSEFQARRSPDLSSRILSLRGLLQPGYSGAPILAGNGGVVAVGSGGLVGGFADVNWAIPIEAATWASAQNASSELTRLSAMPANAAFQVLELSPKIELIDSAKVELRRLRTTVVPIREATNFPFDGRLSIAGGSSPRVRYVCKNTGCPDGTVGNAVEVLLTPTLAIQEPIHREALLRPGFQQYLLLDQLVLEHGQQTQRAVENQTIPADAGDYKVILDRARTACHLDASAVDSTLGGLARLRGLEKNALFWGGHGPSAATAVYQVIDSSRLAQFGHYLITIGEASGQSYDRATTSSVRDVTTMISAEYENANSTLNDFEKTCDTAVTPAAMKEITISLHRPGSMDCPILPETAQLTVAPVSGAAFSTVNISKGCKATLNVAASSTGSAKLQLNGAAPYVLLDPEATHGLAAKEWETSVTPSPGMRLVVSISSYAGQCHHRDQVYEMFESILLSKAHSLRGLFDRGDSRFNYLTALNVIPANLSSPVSVDEIHAYWRANELLQVLSGLCISKNDGDEMVSSIFSGDLGGELPEPYTVNLKITENEFRTNRDLHSATMLFALAQEAQSRTLGQHVVISFLERARELAMQIPDEARQPLLVAIDRSLRVAGAPTSRLIKSGSPQ